MKKFLYVVLGLLVVMILQGWSFFKIFNKNTGPDNGFAWYQIKENGLYGAVDERDNILLPCHFQSISLSNDWKNGNKYTDYLWQLKWEVVDEHGDRLEIRMYTFDDGWRYYSTYNKRTEKTKVSSRDYDNVIIPYEKQSVSTLFRSKNWFATELAPSITKCHYFYVSISQYGCGIYTENGEAIIPIERKQGPIIACEHGNRVWYMYNNVICDAQGTEIFRVKSGTYTYPVDIEGSRRFKNFYNEITEQYQWYGMDISKYLVYDEHKGFGSLQAKYDKEDYPIDYYIRYTGIKLSSNSSSFNVRPSGNNSTAKEINLRTYTQSSGSVYPSNNYPMPQPSPYPTQTPTPEQTTVTTTPQKHWKTITYQEDCHFCHGLGKCWTCNGKGWCYNDFGIDGTHDCPNCNNGNCTHCNGTGKVTKTKQVYE